MTDYHVIVVGAGPVGMLAALLVEARGLPVVLLEQSEHRHAQSRAVGIMPPSLEILRSVGLDRRFTAAGVLVERADIRSPKKRLGHLDFSALEGDFPFALSLPQDRTEALLEESVRSRPGIRFLRGHRVTQCVDGERGVEVMGETTSGRFRFIAPRVLACDGGRSTMRQVLGIAFPGVTEGRPFIMADFTDTSGWGHRAVFFLTPRGSVESFPLPGGRRRYVLRTAEHFETFPADHFRSELRARAGVDVDEAHRYWQSTFRIQRHLAHPFCSERVFLCGDAAHLMSPVGGQNMNVGFADAEMAVGLVDLLHEKRITPSQAARLYSRIRQGAARQAGRRARLLTLTGTSGGRFWSAARNTVLPWALGLAPRRRMARSLSMYTLPFRTLSRSRFRFTGGVDPSSRREKR